LSVPLSFAQFEREVIGERIRYKIADSKKKRMWMGGVPPLGGTAKFVAAVSLCGRQSPWTGKTVGLDQGGSACRTATI
jgi:hypothetical protein